MVVMHDLFERIVPRVVLLPVVLKVILRCHQRILGPIEQLGLLQCSHVQFLLQRRVLLLFLPVVDQFDRLEARVSDRVRIDSFYGNLLGGP